MQIIGHRGSAGTHPENTIAGLNEAIRVGADMVEIDVRLTGDGQLVLSHDPALLRTHKRFDMIGQCTLDELRQVNPGIATLGEALDVCYGKIAINIEIKRAKAAIPVVDMLRKRIKRGSWQSVLISSFSTKVLRQIQAVEPKAQLALLHHLNPYAFLHVNHRVKLTAVGLHRLHIGTGAIGRANRLGLFTYVYTVNRPDALERLGRSGVDAVVTNYPELFVHWRDKLGRS